MTYRYQGKLYKVNYVLVNDDAPEIWLENPFDPNDFLYSDQLDENDRSFLTNLIEQDIEETKGQYYL